MAQKTKTQAAIERTKRWLDRRIRLRGKDELIYPHCVGEGVTYGELLLVLRAAIASGELLLMLRSEEARLK